jgi:hypothetical protein
MNWENMQGTVLVCLKVLSQNMPRGTEEHNESGLRLGPREYGLGNLHHEVQFVV